jgi:hypothetical protein
MVRKQLYLDSAQDRKLKCLAKQRRCTEAEILRQAIDALPEPDDPIAQLIAMGLIEPRRPLPPELEDLDPDVLHAQLMESLGDRAKDIKLGEAVLQLRAESPY